MTRIITTPEELDAVTDPETVLMDCKKRAYQWNLSMGGSEGWFSVDDPTPITSHHLLRFAPLTVLHDPSAPSVPAPDPDDREVLAGVITAHRFRRLTVTPEMIEAGAKELARLDLCLPSRDRRPAARAVLEAALEDTK